MCSIIRKGTIKRGRPNDGPDIEWSGGDFGVIVINM